MAKGWCAAVRMAMPFLTVRMRVTIFGFNLFVVDLDWRFNGLSPLLTLRIHQLQGPTDRRSRGGMDLMRGR